MPRTNEPRCREQHGEAMNEHHIRRIWSAFALSATLVPTGCTVGPDFAHPQAPAAKAYLAPSDRAPRNMSEPGAALGAGPQGRWWEAFGSPELDSLVDRALSNNLTLVASRATLAAADAEARAIAGKQLPQVDASARVDQEQVNLSSFGFQPSPALGLASNPAFHLYSLGGSISYDLDLFGGLRRQAEQGAAQAEAQRRATEAAHLSVAGRVVGQALAVAALRNQIEVANALLADDQRNIDLAEKRRSAGEGTLVEVLNARAQYQGDRSEIPQLNQELAAALHLLATLTGSTPAEFSMRSIDLDALSLPAEVPVTMPSEIVHKRPDILHAEAELHAASAAIGVATAKLYPDITLGATLTQGAPALDTLVKNAFRGYDVFAGLAAPIFHGGTLRAQRDAAVARARAARADYQQTVLVAFEQVSDLLSALQNDAHSVADERDSTDVASRSLALSRRSFEVGNSGILQVLDAERLYQRARTNLLIARARQLANVSRLYVASAGGWISPDGHSGEHSVALP